MAATGELPEGPPGQGRNLPERAWGLLPDFHLIHFLHWWDKFC